MTQYCETKLDTSGLPDDALRVKEVYTSCIVTANSGEIFEEFLVTDIFFWQNGGPPKFRIQVPRYIITFINLMAKWRTSKSAVLPKIRHIACYKI